MLFHQILPQASPPTFGVISLRILSNSALRFLSFIFLFSLMLSSLTAQQFITDVIIINGARHAPIDVDKVELKRKLDQVLTERQMTLIDNQLERAHPDSILYAAELYIYKYHGERAIVNLIIRSEKGIHFQYWKPGPSTSAIKPGIETVVDELIVNMPLRFDLSKCEKFSSSRMIYFDPKTVNKKNSSDSLVTLSPEFDEELSYFIPGNFKDYVVNCFNVEDIWKELESDKISIYFDINERGEASYKRFEPTISIDEIQEKRLIETIEAFPIFKVHKTYKDLKVEVLLAGRETARFKNQTQKYSLVVVVGLLVSGFWFWARRRFDWI